MQGKGLQVLEPHDVRDTLSLMYSCGKKRKIITSISVLIVTLMLIHICLSISFSLSFPHHKCNHDFPQECTTTAGNLLSQ